MKEMKPHWKLDEENARHREKKKLALEIAKAMSQSIEIVNHWPCTRIVGNLAFRIASGLEEESWENIPDVHEPVKEDIAKV